MREILFRQLKLADCDRLSDMNPTQYIKRAYRIVDGKRQLVDINYLDTDFPEGYETHYQQLKESIQHKGIAFGAFEDEKLIGFASINREIFGHHFRYVLLDQMFISLEYRNKGIGKYLFKLCATQAKNWNADKIYICAGSAEETIQFYFRLGCVEANEISQELYDLDERDYQLEYSLT